MQNKDACSGESMLIELESFQIDDWLGCDGPLRGTKAPLCGSRRAPLACATDPEREHARGNAANGRASASNCKVEAPASAH